MASNPNLVAPRYVDVDVDGPFKIVGSVAATCFIGALLTDIVYARAPDFVWVTFSVWAITIGLVVALVATVVGLIDRVASHRLGTLGTRWPYLLGFALLVAVEIVNAFVHSRDAYQSVVPEGITLSVVAVVLLVGTMIVGRTHLHARSRKTP